METDAAPKTGDVEAPPPAAAGGGTYGGVAGNSPPTYQEATTDAPPPSYQSLYGEIKEAKKNSSGVGVFLVAFFAIIFGTVAATFLVAVSLAIPIAMIVIGSIYVDDCPLERYIPIYLIVGGSVSLVSLCCDLGRRGKNRMENSGETDEDDSSNKGKGACGSLISCFLLAWFIAGNIWVYRNFPPNVTNPNSAFYCDHTLYYFAFWLLNSTYIIMGLACCVVCCAACLFGSGSSD